MKIRVIVNNTKFDPKFRSDIGFSIFIEGLKEGVLFDTGPNFDILKENLRHSGITLKQIKHIVISHRHADHTGGLKKLIKFSPPDPHNPNDLKVYIPDPDLITSESNGQNSSEDKEEKQKFKEDQDFKENLNEFRKRLNKRDNRKIDLQPIREIVYDEYDETTWKAKIEKINIENIEIIKDIVYSSGVFEVEAGNILEQALVIKTRNGLVIVAACSHPGIDNIVSIVRDIFGVKEIYLVLGGFYLRNRDEKDITEIMNKLKDELGVKKISPSHSSGELAKKVAVEIFGYENYIDSGAGAVIKI